MRIKFKQFLLNENNAYLGQKVGDILTAAQEINADSKTMSSRDLIRFSERIVGEIRRILQSDWTKEQRQYLLQLQKVGVAIMKSIEEKGDLPETMANATSYLEKIVKDLGVPIHKFASPDTEEESDDVETAGPETAGKERSGPEKSQGPIIPSPPTNPPMDTNTPPLGGNNTGQLNNL